MTIETTAQAINKSKPTKYIVHINAKTFPQSIL